MVVIQCPCGARHEVARFPAPPAVPEDAVPPLPDSVLARIPPEKREETLARRAAEHQREVAFRRAARDLSRRIYCACGGFVEVPLDTPVGPLEASPTVYAPGYEPALTVGPLGGPQP